MRIAYLTQSYPPMVSGAAISAKQIAETMAQQGHKVLVLAASDREYAYNVYSENITVMRLRSVNNPLRVGQRLLPNPRCKVMMALEQFKPDAVHVHEPFQMGIFGLGYAKHARIPLVVTVHQLPWFVASYFPESFRPFIEKTLWLYARISLKRYAAVISPTQTIATIIEQKIGLKPNVISYGLDTQRFHPPFGTESSTGKGQHLANVTRKRLDLPLNTPLILHAGRLDKDKNVDNVIRAVAPAIRESKAHLLIVGDGCLKKRLIHLCMELDIDQRVHFAGYVSPQDMPEIYRAADIFITASEVETQGIVLLEAAASGLPIVAVDATCISEVVHDQVNGILVRPGDIGYFSEAVLTLINHPKRSSKMGLNGRILIKKYNTQNTWSQHETLYLEMIKQNSIKRVLKNSGKFPQWEFVKELIGLK